ncbi:alcohol dehydrogenase catalytic domain-containing protein [Lentzea sp. NPDC059081]|uniref:alcohol dehydrogenase catalytic domain-containing protein n=1 Tax=Lentzea sp. NPDC059081 TaxID=3346719 RepID=UPI0036C4D835
MKAAVLSAPGVVGVADVPDARIEKPGDAVVRVVAAGICGTDLRGYAGLPGPVTGPLCGHEFVGVVEDVGHDVVLLRPGQFVVAPFMFSDGVCLQCARGQFSSCRAGGMWGIQAGGGQAEAVRVPFADATLVPVALERQDERIPAILALADVMATGRHAVLSSGRGAPRTVAVVGDGAVGLCSVLAARQAGADTVLLLGHHEARAVVARGFGATEVITADDDHVEAVLAATGGAGADLVVEATANRTAAVTALAACADGGVVSLVGGPHAGIDLMTCFGRGLTITGGLVPARRYLPSLVRAVLAGELDPSPVFDREMALSDVEEGYRAMANRQTIKVLLKP